MTDRNKSCPIVSRSIERFVMGLLLLVLTGWMGCIPEEKQQVREIRFDLAEPGVRRVIDLQDRRALDTLAGLLADQDPTLRYHAAVALASVGDSSSVEALVPLLRDPVEAIRVAAAHALGQTGSPKAAQPLIEAFDPWDTLGHSARLNATILEAVGKTGDAANLADMARVKTYHAKDTAYTTGQARAILQFAQRGILDSFATLRMVSILAAENGAREARLVAASYLVRTKDIRYDTLVLEMVTALRNDGDPELRMALASAVGKTRNPLAMTSLLGLLPLEKDYRVRVNMVKALGWFAYPDVKEGLRKAVQDSSTAVGMAAAETLQKIGDPQESQEWLQVARGVKDPWVRAQLYRTLSRICPVALPGTRSAIQNDLKQALASTRNPWLRGVLLGAYGQFAWNVNYLRDEWSRARHPYVRSSALEALKDISDRPDFYTVFGSSAWRVRRSLGEFFADVLRSNDVGSVAIAAVALRTPTAGYRQFLRPDTSFVRALQNCSLPKDIETYNEVATSRAFFRGGKPVLGQVPYTHPIDWGLIDKLKSNSRAVIMTAKGSIILVLYPQRAPGSVANFIELAQKGFFDGKVFHRVVPNFVIQGGCPRGDGYGALDYTIRSELWDSRFNRSGLLGMASAGRHTEGTQFFITHSPAPHLDGRYSCFGEVEKGMETVHAIMPGDTIQKIEIIF